MAIMLHAFLVNVSFVFERRVKGNIMDKLFFCLLVKDFSNFKESATLDAAGV